MKTALLVSIAICCVTHAATVYTPDSVYVFTADAINLEAEQIRHSAVWREEKTDTGFTGRGYLKYVGPPRICVVYKPIPGTSWFEPLATDTNGSCQPSMDDRLLIPTHLTTPGAYSVNIYSHHRNWAMKFDDPKAELGVWTHIVNWRLPVKMSNAPDILVGHTGQPTITDSMRNGWQWLAFGPDYPNSGLTANCNAFGITVKDTGFVTFYIAGMHTNFCADRISIYRRTGPNQFPAGCMNLKAPVATLYPRNALPTAIAPGAVARADERHLSTIRPSRTCDLRGRIVVSPAVQGLTIGRVAGQGLKAAMIR
jgi:hypothetical protein